MKKKDKRSDFFAFLHDLINKHKDDASKVELQKKLESLMFEFARSQTLEDKKMLTKFSYFDRYFGKLAKKGEKER